ncbi:dipeptidase [soil metagenome]
MPPFEYLNNHREEHLEQLLEWLRIPSVSAKSENDEDTRHAAEWLAERMREAGLDAELIKTKKHPIVIGEWRKAKKAPTLLVYGHYDVQPAEPLDEWKSPPFEPAVRAGKLYARGSVDDKGQIFLHLKAVEAHLAENGKLPVNVVFVVEGEEEVGSPSLEHFLKDNKKRLACDAVLISDTTMFAPKTPSITVGLRGMAYMEVRVKGPPSDLHSGSYGGAVANPANALCKMVAALHDDEGRIAIPGFYDEVRTLSAQDRTAIRELPYEVRLRSEVGGALAGEATYSALERVWIRPTLDLNGLFSGYTGEGAKTVLPAKATAKISMRLVPDQQYKDIEKKFTEHFKHLAPDGIEVEVKALHGGQPWHAEPEGPVFEAAKRALKRAFGKDPVLIREGGSIPIVGAFEEALEAPVVLIGFGLPGENAHAPNEWISVDNFHRGAEAIANLYEELA